MQSKVVQKYLPAFLVLGLGTAFGLDPMELELWQSAQSAQMLHAQAQQNPQALERLELDQKWLFSSRSQALNHGLVQSYGFPFLQGIALGHGDSLGKSALWRLDYRYQRRGFAQDDFLFYASPWGDYQAQSAHWTSLHLAWKKLAISAGLAAGEGKYRPLGSLHLGPISLHALGANSKWNWETQFFGEKRLGDTLGRHSWTQYLPRIGLWGRGSEYQGWDWEQNLLARHLYGEIRTQGSDHLALLKLYSDASRLGSLQLGYSELNGHRRLGGALDLLFLRLSYADPMERLERGPFAQDWSIALHFGLEGLINKSVQRPGASMPLMPEITKKSARELR